MRTQQEILELLQKTYTNLEEMVQWGVRVLMEAQNPKREGNSITLKVGGAYMQARDLEGQFGICLREGGNVSTIGNLLCEHINRTFNVMWDIQVKQGYTWVWNDVNKFDMSLLGRKFKILSRHDGICGDGRWHESDKTIKFHSLIDGKVCFVHDKKRTLYSSWGEGWWVKEVVK